MRENHLKLLLFCDTSVMPSVIESLTLGKHGFREENVYFQGGKKEYYEVQKAFCVLQCFYHDFCIAGVYIQRF